MSEMNGPYRVEFDGSSRDLQWWVLHADKGVLETGGSACFDKEGDACDACALANHAHHTAQAALLAALEMIRDRGCARKPHGLKCLDVNLCDSCIARAAISRATA